MKIEIEKKLADDIGGLLLTYLLTCASARRSSASPDEAELWQIRWNDARNIALEYARVVIRAEKEEREAQEEGTPL